MYTQQQNLVTDRQTGLDIYVNDNIPFQSHISKDEKANKQNKQASPQSTTITKSFWKGYKLGQTRGWLFHVADISTLEQKQTFWMFPQKPRIVSKCLFLDQNQGVHTYIWLGTLSWENLPDSEHL